MGANPYRAEGFSISRPRGSACYFLQLHGRAGRLQQALASSEAQRAQEVEHYRANAEAARLALARASDRLNEAEAQLARQRAGDDETRARIARLQASLEGERSSARRSESRVRELEGQLDGSKRELAAQGGRIAELGDLRRLWTVY